MSHSINRRTFVGSSVVAGAASLTPGFLTELLASQDAPTQVFAVLQETLALQEIHRPIVDEFTKSLITTRLHGQKPDETKNNLQKRSLDNEQKLYVTAEFVASTNYLAFSMGHVQTLKMLKGRLNKTADMERMV